jgi:hypothetical protein
MGFIAWIVVGLIAGWLAGRAVSMTTACRRHGADGAQSLCNPYAPSDNPKKR